jgi:ABC-type polysaccharide/polyol phosphate export permease
VVNFFVNLFEMMKRQALFLENLYERNFRLAVHLALRDHRQRFVHSSLGTLWSPLSIILTSLVLSVVYSVLFKIDIKTYLPFVLSGTAAWSLVQGMLGEAPTHFVASKSLLINTASGVEVATLHMTFRNLINATSSIIVSVLISSTFNSWSWDLLILPVSILVVSFSLMPYCFAIGLIGVYFRDLEQFFPPLLLILYLTTPILFPVEQLGSFASLVRWSPFYILVSLIRNPIIGQSVLPNSWHGCLVINLIGISLWMRLRVGGRKVKTLL